MAEKAHHKRQPATEAEIEACTIGGAINSCGGAGKTESTASAFGV